MYTRKHVWFLYSVKHSNSSTIGVPNLPTVDRQERKQHQLLGEVGERRKALVHANAREELGGRHVLVVRVHKRRRVANGCEADHRHALLAQEPAVGRARADGGNDCCCCCFRRCFWARFWRARRWSDARYKCAPEAISKAIAITCPEHTYATLCTRRQYCTVLVTNASLEILSLKGPWIFKFYEYMNDTLVHMTLHTY